MKRNYTRERFINVAKKLASIFAGMQKTPNSNTVFPRPAMMWPRSPGPGSHSPACRQRPTLPASALRESMRVPQVPVDQSPLPVLAIQGQP